MKFGVGLVGDVSDVGVDFCMVFFLIILISFDSQGVGVECVMG